MSQRVHRRAVVGNKQMEGRDQENRIVMIEEVPCVAEEFVCGVCFYNFRSKCSGTQCLPYEREDKRRVYFRRVEE